MIRVVIAVAVKDMTMMMDEGGGDGNDGGSINVLDTTFFFCVFSNPVSLLMEKQQQSMLQGDKDREAGNKPFEFGHSIK